MKKSLVFLFIIALTLVYTLALFGCSNTQDISEVLVEEEGLQYLTLPISKKKSNSNNHQASKIPTERIIRTVGDFL